MKASVYYDVCTRKFITVLFLVAKNKPIRNHVNKSIPQNNVYSMTLFLFKKNLKKDRWFY